MSVFVQQEHTVCDFASSDSWVILSPIEQSIKRKIEAVGTPLKDWDINIYRGVLTGCNEAFIITSDKRKEILSHTADYVAGQADVDYAPTGEYRRTAELIRPNKKEKIIHFLQISLFGTTFAALLANNECFTTMATTAENTPMQTYILSFNPKDKRATKFMETIKLMDFFKVEESPYDPHYVAPVTKPKTSTKAKMSSAEISLKEIEEGKVFRAKSVNDLFKQCGINV